MPGSMDDICQRFAKNVRRLRRAMDMSQEEFAHRAGVHRTYISDVERGKRNPSITIVEQFATALRVSAGSLLD
ncbi:MAG: transcriptional regulator [Sphingomonas bacterium]|nr:transcriptional regulator [Sphingomonas bacterium]